MVVYKSMKHDGLWVAYEWEGCPSKANCFSLLAEPRMNNELLDEFEQNIVICQCLADQLICETLTNHYILR